ncbi:hypothetical protein BKA61DRAFT_631655 [Leptodontidium sp. MPI-SDFR-AT-0119]|nr:hypothetical protein BKA61DRAFT_631655 [Leptodontidium sp. MPI-SDFR-AT-0119]
MRIWEFDRLGGIASERFDVNENGLRFVSTLGFDSTTIIADGRRYIEIERNGQRERLIIDEVMKRAPCIAGRATTYSWQYPEREEEGELLREATNKGVVNIARYYYHELSLAII